MRPGSRLGSWFPFLSTACLSVSEIKRLISSPTVVESSFGAPTGNSVPGINEPWPIIPLAEITGSCGYKSSGCIGAQVILQDEKKQQLDEQVINSGEIADVRTGQWVYVNIEDPSDKKE